MAGASQSTCDRMLGLAPARISSLLTYDIVNDLNISYLKISRKYVVCNTMFFLPLYWEKIDF